MYKEDYGLHNRYYHFIDNTKLFLQEELIKKNTISALIRCSHPLD